MEQTRLTIEFGPGFCGDLWAWRIKLVQAPSGRVEVFWHTSTFETHATRERRFRARTLPEWWPAISSALAQVDFDSLPPSREWDVWMDDVATLSVEHQRGDDVSGFSVFYAPELWPALPGQTREALRRVVALLDPLARRLHSE